MLKIKVCGLRDPQNVADVARLFPDFMGFVFYRKSPRYIGKSADNALFSGILPGIIKTGVFVNEKSVNVKIAVARYRLDAVQFHGSESADYCRQFQKEGILIIKAFGIDRDFDFNVLNLFMESCDYFLFDTKTESPGGSGKKFDWSILEDYKLDKPFFISGGISFDDIPEVLSLRHYSLFGVDINSRFEISPGIKNVNQIKSFIDEIRKI